MGVGPSLVQESPLAALRDDEMHPHAEPAQEIEDSKANSRA